jgi:predicted phage terminase large subunit-like protein
MNLTTTDLELIAEHLLRTFSPAELAANPALLQQPIDSAFRRALAEADFVFFCKFYLAKHFKRELSPLHRSLAAELLGLLAQPGRVNSVVMMPRGFGKTTICTLAYPLWCICFSKRQYLVIISDSSDQAEAQLATLKAELESNERIREDFGVGPGPTWAADQLLTNNGIKVDALGAGKKIRGRKYRQFRPDLMIFDDIENLEEVMSETMREKRKKWFRQDAMRAGWDDTKVIVIGNMLHHACLLAELAANPLFRVHKHQALLSWAGASALWDEWESAVTNKADEHRFDTGLAFYQAHREAMDEGAISAWPEAFSYYDLMLMRASEGHPAFATEMMNDPLDPSRTLFHKFVFFRQELRQGAPTPELWLVPLNDRPAVALSSCLLFGGTDPSLGKTNSSDYTAITVLAKAPNGYMFVLRSEIERRTPDSAMKRQVELGAEFAFTKFGIENNQFQALFESKSGEASVEAGVYLPIEGVTSVANKDFRLQSLEPDVSNGYIMFAEHGQELLLQQLREYPLGEHDDGPDSLEITRTIATRYHPIAAPPPVLQAEQHTFSSEGAQLLQNSEQDPFAEAEASALAAEAEERLLTGQPEMLPEPFTPVTIL